MTKHSTNSLEKKCLQVIKKHRLVFIMDVVTFLPIGRSSFYTYGLDKLDSIKDALEENKIDMKREMRSKWKESPAPALQLGLMKLLSSDDERRALSTSFMETKQKHKVEDLSQFTTAQLTDMLRDEPTKEDDKPETDS